MDNNDLFNSLFQGTGTNSNLIPGFIPNAVQSNNMGQQDQININPQFSSQLNPLQQLQYFNTMQSRNNPALNMHFLQLQEQQRRGLQLGGNLPNVQSPAMANGMMDVQQRMRTVSGNGQRPQIPGTPIQVCCF
jgi:hypothetical protein